MHHSFHGFNVGSELKFTHVGKAACTEPSRLVPTLFWIRQTSRVTQIPSRTGWAVPSWFWRARICPSHYEFV